MNRATRRRRRVTSDKSHDKLIVHDIPQQCHVAAKNWSATYLWTRAPDTTMRLRRRQRPTTLAVTTVTVRHIIIRHSNSNCKGICLMNVNNYITYTRDMITWHTWICTYKSGIVSRVLATSRTFRKHTLRVSCRPCGSSLTEWFESVRWNLALFRITWGSQLHPFRRYSAISYYFFLEACKQIASFVFIHIILKPTYTSQTYCRIQDMYTPWAIKTCTWYSFITLIDVDRYS